MFLLWALHWLHLSADFPNGSPWMDYAKYTDEGWYSNAAMRAVLFGHWFFPGDFNPAVALPVWPALEWIAFKTAGVSMVAARALALVVFAGNLVLSYLLLRAAGAGRRYALGGLLLLASSMYLWAFSRLAILEPLLSFWIMAGWLLAMRLQRLGGMRRMAAPVGLGVLGALAVLTKTTAVFLLPGTVALLFAMRDRTRGRWLRSGAQDAAVASVAGLVLWGVYFLLAMRAHALDYHYLFTANQWEAPHSLRDRLLAFWWAAHGLLWVGPRLVCLMVVVLAAALGLSAALRRVPLVWASLLAIAGYLFFIGWHNSPQPRYYMVLVYPVIFLTMLGLQALMERLPRRLAAGLGVGCGLMLAWFFTVNCYYSLEYALHPEYTLRAAAEGIARYIQAHPDKPLPVGASLHGPPFLSKSPLLLSISGDDITLFTGQAAICDDFGTDSLPDRIARYRPGWYAEWNEMDPGTLEDIHAAGYRLQPAAQWHALDDEDRDELFLYRMVRVADPAKLPP